MLVGRSGASNQHLDWPDRRYLRQSNANRDRRGRAMPESELEWIPRAILRRARAYLRHVRCSADEREELLRDAVHLAYAELPADTPPEAAWARVLIRLRHGAARTRRRSRWERAERGTDVVVPEQGRQSSYLLSLWDWEGQLLQRLPSAERAALEWFVMDGCDDRDIASRLGISQNSVRVLRHRAKRRRRMLIEQDEHPAPPERAGDPT